MLRKSAGERQQKWLKSKQEQGLVRCEVLVPAKFKKTVQQVAALLVSGGRIIEGDRSIIVTKKWTNEVLANELANHMPIEKINFSEGEEAGVISAKALNGISVYVTACGEQILSTALLWKRSEQEDPEKFEAMMLRHSKRFLPLSALSITDLGDGEEWYEIYGSMSAEASLDQVVHEINTIAHQAEELARDLGPVAA